LDAILLAAGSFALPSALRAEPPPKPKAVGPLAALARSRVPFVPAAFEYVGDYDDRLHPLCARHISVEGEQTPSGAFIAHFSGTDVGPPGIGAAVSIGCDEQNVLKYKLREWDFDARISADGTQVDAGDGVHVGQWHRPSSTDEWAGIRWKDGNRWVRRTPS